jgi:hypothetical protein
MKHINMKTLLWILFAFVLLTLTGCEDKGCECGPDVTAPLAVATVTPRVSSEGDPVTFDASGSSDPDGSIISYQWTEDSGTLSRVSGVKKMKASSVLSTEVSFTTSTLGVGLHTITLTVTDDDGATGMDEVNVTVNALDNQPPVADAGVDQTVTEESSVTLDGSGSSDPDGSIVSYLWTEGSTTLSTTVSFTKTDFSVGVHTLTLTVTDDDDATDADDVNITVTGLNTAPVAVITKPLANTTYYCYEGSSPSIVLDGSESSDKDGDALTYAWSGTVGINTVSINSLINDRTNKVTSITRDDLCNFVGNVDNDVNCSSTGDVASLAKTRHTEGSNNIAIYDPGTDSGCTVTIDLNVSDGSASGSDKAKVNIRIHFPT